MAISFHFVYLALCEEVGVFLSGCLLRIEPLHCSSLGCRLGLIGYRHIHISISTVSEERSSTCTYTVIFENFFVKNFRFVRNDENFYVKIVYMYMY